MFFIFASMRFPAEIPAFCCILCSNIRVSIKSHHHGMRVSRYVLLRTTFLLLGRGFRLVARWGCKGMHESEFGRKEGDGIC